ncbi:MAG: FliM/FliN family flagellar motor switch protein [Actinomycetota bacterium]|nr:FliM/FliN family flagellar motor switch protein [Actinomycetota bacterium]
MSLQDALLDVELRLHAELGRARMPLAGAVDLPAGAIVDLDRAPQDPVDVYVNGRRFASARLIVVDGEWAVRLEAIEAGWDAQVSSPAADH